MWVIVQLWTIHIMDLDADSVFVFLYGLEKANFLSGTKINKLPLSYIPRTSVTIMFACAEQLTNKVGQVILMN